MPISSKQIQELRAQTGAGILDAKQALEEASGDMDGARVILRTKGIIKAEKKSQRAAHEGRIAAYIHSNGKIGVLVKVYCETDFVARNEEFGAFVHELALHIAAANPQYIAIDNIPSEVKEAEMRIYREQLGETNKPKEIIEQIVEGKMGKFAQEFCLLQQPYVKDPDKTIGELFLEAVAKFGENIQIGEFVRYEL